MDNDDLLHRLQNLLGVDMTNVNATGLMTDGHLTDEPKGIVATNADGTAFGMAEILLENMSNVMAAYDMSPTQYGAVMGWVSGWATSDTSAQLGLLGGVGTMNAEQFVNQTFRHEPVGDPYLDNSLNLGGAWKRPVRQRSGDLPKHNRGTFCTATSA